MIIFLRNIPATTQYHDILEFIEPVLKGGFFSRKGTASSIKILVLEDKNFHTREYHGLVKVDQEAVAERVIKKLNRKLFKGRRIAVREYKHRTWHGDRRVNWDDMVKLQERRKNDRRRSHLEVVDDMTDKFTNKGSFHRKLE